MGQYDQGQPSPYQALLEQAASQELGKPRGRWVTDIRENYSLPTTRPQWTPDGRMYMERDPGNPSQMAALSQAAAHSDAAMNAAYQSRLATLLGAPSQNTAANASATQAKAMADELAWKMSPSGQRFALQSAAVHNTQNPASDPATAGMIGGTPDPSVLARKAVGVEPAAAMPQPGVALADFEARGGGPGTAEAAAVAAMNPAYVRGRLAGEPQHWYERTLDPDGDVNVGDILQLGLPVGIREGTKFFGLGPGRTSRQVEEQRVRRLFPDGMPAGVGVPPQVSQAPRLGVQRTMDERAARRQKFESIRGSDPSMANR